MKKSVCILSYVLLLFLINSCNKEQKDFARAKQKNSIEALKEFLSNYPDGKYIDSAKLTIDNLIWQSVLSKNAISDYESFIKEYPGSKFVDSAKATIDKQFPIIDVEKALKFGKVKLELEAIQGGSNVKLQIISNLKNTVRIKISSGKTILSGNQIFKEFAITSPADIILNLDAGSKIDKVLIQSGSAKVTKGKVILDQDLISLGPKAEVLVSIN